MLVSIAAVGLLAATAFAQSTSDPVHTTTPTNAPTPQSSGSLADNSEAALRAWGGEVRGQIETIAGRQFTGDVDIRVVDKDELARIVNESVQKEMKDKQPNVDSTLLYVRSMHASYQIADRTIGMYNRARKTVYVVTSNMPVLFKSIKENRLLTGKVVRLAIAHELVHALQDQHVHTDALFDAAHTTDANQALQCVIEGQAVVVAEALAERLGWQDASAQLSAVTSSVMSSNASAQDKGRSRAGADPDARHQADESPGMVYERGRRLVLKRQTSGGVEAVWELFKKTPKSMQEVLSEIQGEPQLVLPEPSQDHPGKK